MCGHGPCVMQPNLLSDRQSRMVVLRSSLFPHLLQVFAEISPEQLKYHREVTLMKVTHTLPTHTSHTSYHLAFFFSAVFSPSGILLVFLALHMIGCFLFWNLSSMRGIFKKSFVFTLLYSVSTRHMEDVEQIFIKYIDPY